MATTNDQNLVVLTIYIIGVAYVFNLMVESIDDRIKYEFKKGDVDEKLKEQGLADKISVNFKLKPSEPIDELKELSMTVENKSDDLAIYVDWDNSSLIINNKSCRVIRKSPDLTRDLAISQSPSLIVPKKTLTETITAEDLFERDKDTGIYTVKKPLLNISGLQKGGPPQKKMYSDFMNRGKELGFSLQLVLRLSEIRAGLAPGAEYPPICIIDCPFTVRKLPWTYALPWNKKK
ncbi:MAG TPA: hypothetical protein IGS40_27885 [Trichormus sp. M33_DOE_039]|nr:hypothetical protein [Trichormus sp. M33_DOE_039]